MKDELSPEAVAERLQYLRQTWKPEDPDSVRKRMESRHRLRASTFDEAVARRLAELRALLELTAYLHGHRSSPTKADGSASRR